MLPTYATALPAVSASVDCPTHGSTWPINSVVPPEPSGSCKLETDVCPSIFLPLNRIWSELQRYAPESMSSYVQNVGAKDGLAADPLLPLFRAYPNTAAVAMEPSNRMFPRLQRNMQQFANVRPLKAAISPSNAVELLRYDTHRNGSATVRTMDIFKLDIDGCECHILEVLLSSPEAWAHPKVIQIEMNHLLIPPLGYRDMCANDAPGRSTGQGRDLYSNLDVWGCSVQAAYDIVRPHGYKLLQYDWPDAVFVHSNFSAAFPCIPVNEFMRTFWVGYMHARQHYRRWKLHQTHNWFADQLPELAMRSVYDPRQALELIVATYNSSWVKSPLWLEMSVAGSSCRLTVKRASAAVPLQMHWHQCAPLKESALRLPPLGLEFDSLAKKAKFSTSTT